MGVCELYKSPAVFLESAKGTSCIVSVVLRIARVSALTMARLKVHDIAEIDFEILTSTIDTSSTCVPAGIWATTHVSN